MTYTRASIEAAFTVVGDRIVSPGQFEGQPRYAPYFHEKAAGKTLVTVRAADVAEFPELEGYAVVMLETAPDGRVAATPFVSADYW